MKLFWLIFIFTITAFNCADSKNYNNIPSYADKTSAQRKECESQPVAPTIQTLACEKSEDEIKKDKYEANEKPDLDRDLTSYTAWITWLTCGMLASAVAQAGFFWWQLKLMNASIEDANKSFIMINRPKIKVKNVTINEVTDIGIADGNIINGSFKIENIGSTAAYITNCSCKVHWSKSGLKMSEAFNDRHIISLKVTQIYPGESVVCDFISDEAVTLTQARTVGTKVIQGWDLYIIGIIEYTDGINIKRRTSFCRIYKRPDGEAFHQARFYPVDDQDYEYEQ